MIPPPPPFHRGTWRRTSTILTLPTLLQCGAAEPLGLFGGRLTLEAKLLAIFRSCSTTVLMTACRPQLYLVCRTT